MGPRVTGVGGRGAGDLLREGVLVSLLSLGLRGAKPKAARPSGPKKGKTARGIFVQSSVRSCTGTHRRQGGVGSPLCAFALGSLHEAYTFHRLKVKTCNPGAKDARKAKLAFTASTSKVPKDPKNQICSPTARIGSIDLYG